MQDSDGRRRRSDEPRRKIVPDESMGVMARDDSLAENSPVILPERRASLPVDGTSPDDIVRVFGRKVRRLRQAAGLTLEQVARASGVSIGALSQIERGLGNPSLATVFRVAQSLGSSAGKLLDGQEPGPVVVRRDERAHIDLHGGDPDDGVFHLLTPPGRPFEVIWMETPPGHCTEQAPYVHEGEEVGLVISGIKEIHIGDHSYVLNAGDTITYSSHVPHWYRNLGPDPVVSMWVLMRPRAD